MKQGGNQVIPVTFEEWCTHYGAYNELLALRTMRISSVFVRLGPTVCVNELLSEQSDEKRSNQISLLCSSNSDF